MQRDKTSVDIINAVGSVDDLVFFALMFSLPMGWGISIIPSILFVIFLVIRMFDRSYPGSLQLRLPWFFFSLPFLFIANLISLYYTENISSGMASLSKEANMLILPLLMYKIRFAHDKVRRGLSFFIAGLCLSIAIGVISAIVKSYFTNTVTENTFPASLDSVTPIFSTFTASGSAFMHPGYMALMVATGCVIILYRLSIVRYSILYQYTYILIAGVFGFYLLMLSTLSALLLFIAVVVAGVVVLWQQKDRNDDLKWWLVGLIIIWITFFLWHPYVAGLLQGQVPGPEITTRLDVWQTAGKEIAASPWVGYGIGDFQSVLDGQFKAMGMPLDGLNPHNQFLQLCLIGGILPALVLLGLLLYIFSTGLERKQLLLTFFPILAFISFMTESVLHRYWGILFFSLFIPLLSYFAQPEN